MYQTIAAPAEDEFVQQKSRFLGAIVPVQTEEEALAFIEAKRKHYWDATHNVYAYIIRAKDGLPEIKRCSDDGEPQGTAGRPALEVLEHIPDVESAVRAAVRMARRYVVVTVPSKPDDNPEHIHLLTKERLTELFEAAGCRRLHFDGVPGHLFVAAPLGKEG